MDIKISTTNTKLGYQIPSISLAPECSCRPDAPCARGCYAKKGNFTYKNVQESRKHNYDLYVKDADAYFGEIIAFLSDRLIGYKYFRWHVSGDIVDDAYLLGMIRVAKACKGVKFLCFTKKFDIVNRFLSSGEKLPSNLRIIFSAWFKGFKVDNPFNLPIAYVFFKDTSLNPDIDHLAIPCIGDCSRCLSCWSLKKGQSVVFHQH